MNAKPKILLSESDADRLERLLDSTSDSAFPGKAELQAEIDRAEVVASAD
ncbi:MAG TPA: nucleoside diphosphate kinase regulator, partial [Gammaproteobacteria bacterium]|nr:nucleoside diphosphate kinase regulator [Gammaproteobacteria bacterium]